MRRTGFIFLILSFLTPLTVFSAQAEKSAGTDQRESVLDKKVYIEKKLITEIPQVPRLCDSLNIKKQRINVGDCGLYVEEEGRGMPLVLINGGPGGTHHYFHPWFSRAKDYVRVIYYDQRGCGLSDYQPGKAGYSIDQAVADLDAVRRALGIDRWVVLGYSYGGFLAQYYATIYPERLSGLILLGADPGMWIEMKPTRQYDFLSKEEQDRMRQIRFEIQSLSKAENWTPEKSMALLVYNNHLNGDWKRQHFYKPSIEKLARGALYEWTYDLKNNFRGGISNSQNKIDLTGAFDKCPVPTLVLEGKWDLTWNTDKPEIIAKNHPGSKLVLFDNAGHGIYDENPDEFFAVLKEFIQGLSKISPPALSAYRSYLTEWDKKRKSSPLYIIKSAGYGAAAMAELAKAYKSEWCDVLNNPSDFLKLGFAHYEVANYSEGLLVFQRMQRLAEKKQNNEYKALALIWQGHVLDLLGKRAEAVACYKQVVDMNIKDSWRHDQYGLQYEVSAYAKERMLKPFVRVENTWKD